VIKVVELRHNCRRGTLGKIKGGLYVGEIPGIFFDWTATWRITEAGATFVSWHRCRRIFSINDRQLEGQIEEPHANLGRKTEVTQSDMCN
jgi:hypothetical protein